MLSQMVNVKATTRKARAGRAVELKRMRKPPVTADTAWRLSALLKTSPEVWMNLQMYWDLWHAAQGRKTA